MKKFQIAEITGQQAHAGTKATEDVITIAEGIGFEPAYIKMNDLKSGLFHKLNRQYRFYRDWSKVYRKITAGSIVLLQHPFHYPQLTRERTLKKLKCQKKVIFISVVHDVEELRTLKKEKYYMHEFKFMMRIADVLIVHNNVMREFFIAKGFDKKKIVVLEIFDYLRNADDEKLPAFEPSVTIAGNLDIKKSGYLSMLPMLDCRFHLYGPNYSLKDAPNITYGGVLPPDQVPEVMTKGFGLIWDGDSAKTCKGRFGSYLKYNNPHKLSLYLSAGLPVIIWKDAAEAEFVEENSVGYAIDSLFEMPELLQRISEDEYRKISENVRKISKKLVDGGYMQQALNKAIRVMCDGNKNI